MCVLCQIKRYFPARNGDISSRDGQRRSDSPASPLRRELMEELRRGNEALIRRSEEAGAKKA